MTYYTRLSWNSNCWVKPSGRLNKCCGPNEDQMIYECRFGFGWEEWLFNPKHIKDGYQYGFMECFNNTNKWQGQNLKEVFLITRKCDGECNKRNQGNWYLVAVIEELEVLTETQQTQIQQHFEANGVIQSMLNDIQNIEGCDEEFGECRDGKQALINVRFRMDDVNNRCKKPIPFNGLIKQGGGRFSLYNSKHSENHKNATEHFNKVINKQ